MKLMTFFFSVNVFGLLLQFSKHCTFKYLTLFYRYTETNMLYVLSVNIFGKYMSQPQLAK